MIIYSKFSLTLSPSKGRGVSISLPFGEGWGRGCNFEKFKQPLIIS